MMYLNHLEILLEYIANDHLNNFVEHLLFQFMKLNHLNILYVGQIIEILRLVLLVLKD
jgi:hypothetical protein